MLYMSDEKWKALSASEQHVLIKRETDGLAYWCGLVADGLAVRYAGLIYRLPLCHDTDGY